MAAIEIQTTGESERLKWVTIYTDSNEVRAIDWGNNLLRTVQPKPNLRILDRPFGRVIGAWQEEGYEKED